MADTVLNSSGVIFVVLFSFNEEVVLVFAGTRALRLAVVSAEPLAQHRTLSCHHGGNDFRILLFPVCYQIY